MDISVVVPLYNEEESLPDLVEWITRVMKENQFSYEVIMVDDGSRDKSWEVLQNLRTQYSHIKGVRFRRNYGKSAALQTAFERVQGNVIITMDADLQDSPDEIPELYRMIVEEGYDLVSGYKKKRYDPITKTIPTKLYNWATRKVSGINNLHDFNCGLKAYRKDVVKNIEVYGEMHRFIPVIAKWAGFEKIGEKVVQHRARKYGVTKFGLDRFINGLLDLLSITVTTRYMKRPLHFFGLWGILFSGIGSVILVYLALVRLIGGQWISSRLPLLLFASVFFLLGVILISTGLLGELLSRNSPYKNQYNIAEEVGLE